MQLYQATLFDVTDGLEGAFALPSSDLVACTADAEFQYVKAGRYYLAEVRGYDRSDLTVATKGAPLAVDDSGTPVAPRWETTCWGQDGVTPQDFGLGGADLGSPVEEAAGGMGGASPALGVRSFSKTIVTVRGCEPLSDVGTDGKTRVSIAIDKALVDLRCGSGEDEVGFFRLKPSETADVSAGGAGGAENDAQDGDALVSCGERLLVEAEAGGVVFYEVEGLSQETGEVIWETSCQALPRVGITVSATCDPARAL